MIGSEQKSLPPKDSSWCSGLYGTVQNCHEVTCHIQQLWQQPLIVLHLPCLAQLALICRAGMAGLPPGGQQQAQQAQQLRQGGFGGTAQMQNLQVGSLVMYGCGCTVQIFGHALARGNMTGFPGMTGLGMGPSLVKQNTWHCTLIALGI